MPQVRANGIDIHYETLGDPADPALLLIIGLGAQLIDWPPEFCDLLAGRGFHVILFDNRDCGLSAVLDHLGTPDIAAILAGDRSAAPYVLLDMAADTAGLLTELGVARAHVVGASMGGMVAQQLVIDHPDLVASLCSISSTTGDWTVGRPTPAAAAMLLRPAATDREAVIADAVDAWRLVGSPGFPTPEEDLVRWVAAAYNRSYRPEGTARQYAAIQASPDRTAALGAVKVPTLVVHGEADPLVDVSGGRATAAAVPGAELLVVPGMGHDLPRDVWPQLVDAIAENAARA